MFTNVANTRSKVRAEWIFRFLGVNTVNSCIKIELINKWDKYTLNLSKFKVTAKLFYLVHHLMTCDGKIQFNLEDSCLRMPKMPHKIIITFEIRCHIFDRPPLLGNRFRDTPANTWRITCHTLSMVRRAWIFRGSSIWFDFRCSCCRFECWFLRFLYEYKQID